MSPLTFQRKLLKLSRPYNPEEPGENPVDTGTVQPPIVETSTNKPPGGVDPRTGMVESKFISGLRETLMGDDHPQPWPPRDIINDRAKLVTEMTAMFRALFLRFEKHLDIPRGPANSAL